MPPLTPVNGSLTRLPLAYHVFKSPLPYAKTLALQDAIVQLRLDRKRANPTSETARRDILLLLEHRPTFTTGRRDSLPASLARVQSEQARLAHAGADWAVTRRGGMVTYHGPGQLVGYLLFDLEGMDLGTRCFVDRVQSTLASYVTDSTGGTKVFAPHPDDHVGVFPTVDSKIASIGIQIRRRLTSHGFSLNFSKTPLLWFDLVTACGLDGITATSLPSITSLGSSSASFEYGTVSKEVAELFGKRFADTGSTRSTGEVEELGTTGDDGRGGEVGALVRALEAECESDGKVWRDVPRPADDME